MHLPGARSRIRDDRREGLWTTRRILLVVSRINSITLPERWRRAVVDRDWLGVFANSSLAEAPERVDGGQHLEQDDAEQYVIAGPPGTPFSCSGAMLRRSDPLRRRTG